MRERRVTEWLWDHARVAAGWDLPALTIDQLDDAVDARLAPAAWVMRACEARLRMGHLRYERLLGVDQGPGYLARALRALDRYTLDRNQERIVDAINYLVLEVASPSASGTHYAPRDDGHEIDRGDTLRCPPPLEHTAPPSYWCVGCALWCASDECPRCGCTLPEGLR